MRFLVKSWLERVNDDHDGKRQPLVCSQAQDDPFIEDCNSTKEFVL